MMSLLEQDHVYSYSQLSSFNECPFAFYLERIEKKDQLNNAFAEQGSLVHELLDEWAKGTLLASQLPDEYQRRYPLQVVTAWPHIYGARNYPEKAYELGLRYFREFKGFPDYEIVGSEMKYTTTIAGRKFVGIVDMIVRDKKTNDLIIIDHKSKSLKSFKQSEDEMYRQQYLYSQFVKENFGQYPTVLAFNLFKENGLLMKRPFYLREFEQTIDWAIETMEKIESFDVFDWLQTKEKSDFFCQNICGVRRECPNGYGGGTK